MLVNISLCLCLSFFQDAFNLLASGKRADMLGGFKFGATGRHVSLTFCSETETWLQCASSSADFRTRAVGLHSTHWANRKQLYKPNFY